MLETIGVLQSPAGARKQIRRIHWLQALFGDQSSFKLAHFISAAT